MSLYLLACSNSRITDRNFMTFYIGRICFKFVDILKFCFISDDGSTSNIDNNKTTTATAASTTHAM